MYTTARPTSSAAGRPCAFLNTKVIAHVDQGMQWQCLEEDWLAKHRERLQQTDSRTPRQILQAYADTNNLTVADIDDQIDWNAWDVESPDDNAGDNDTKE